VRSAIVIVGLVLGLLVVGTFFIGERYGWLEARPLIEVCWGKNVDSAIESQRKDPGWIEDLKNTAPVAMPPVERPDF
jgi:hypothetical protein